MREYGIDLLDFYRGTLSVRRLGVLVRELKADSSLVRALNGGQLPWSNLEHRVADLWALWAKQDHPVRVDLETKAKTSAKAARVVELKAEYQKRKRAYGLE